MANPSFDRWLTLYCARPLMATGLLGCAPRVPILMYHSISDELECDRAPYYRICTSPKRFAEQMQWLAEAGYQSVTIADALKSLQASGVRKSTIDKRNPVSCLPTPISDLRREAPQTSHLRSLVSDLRSTSPRKPVVITFDDGFRNVLTRVLPVLESVGFTATVYLPTAYIGDRRKSFNARECLTWSEVSEMRTRGVTFGSHTKSHPVLYQLRWDEIATELVDSKRELEDRLQTPVGSFAYPYAFPQEDKHYVANLKQVLRDAGYSDCVITMIGRVGLGDEPYSLKRLPVNSTDDKPFLSAKLAGAYDWLATAQACIRQMRGWRAQKRYCTPS